MSSQQEKNRQTIICKYVENPNLTYKKIAQVVGVSISTVKRTIKRYKEAKPLSRTPGSGRSKGPRNLTAARKVKQLFTRNPGTSIRDAAEKAATSTSFVQRTKKFYNLRSYKVQVVPDRSEEKELEAQRRARKLYRRYLTKFDCVVMDDETYCKADFKQLPGHEYYTASKKGGVSPKFTTQQHTKFPKKYMVWQAICKCGLRSKEFVTDHTINSEIYIRECLERRLLPFIRQHQGSVLFWPDLATAHYSKTTMEWYQANNVTVVPRDANPPNCPELRPIERYWALMKRTLKRTKQVAPNKEIFRNKWRRGYATVDETMVKNLMKGLNKKVRKFF